MVASVESGSDEEPQLQLVTARRLKMQQAVTWCEHNKGHLNGEKQVEKHERISNISTRAEEIYKLRRLKRTETGAAADNDSTDDDTPLWDLFRKAHDISSSDEEEYEVKEVLDKRVAEDPTDPIVYLVWWKNFRKKDATWESASDMLNSQDVVQDFLNKGTSTKRKKKN